MADVRLTATNPEDSSVVPVACNAKGELLLEEPTIASDDYVAVTGDNMTGDLTLGIDKITLNATDGSAQFAGGNITWNATGEARFLETVNIGSDASPATGNGVTGIVNSSSGSAIVGKNLTANGTNWRGYGSSGVTSEIYADGSAEFAGRLVVNDATRIYRPTSAGGDVKGNSLLTLKSDAVSTDQTVVEIKCDGSAEFAGDVVVGSRNKQWMLVEQNGLCHMVEQPMAATADLARPAAAVEYPPLRDVFAELDAIEKALGDVMEKLRMNPPAGWEVWDGSSENS